MLEPPPLPLATIASCLRAAYGLEPAAPEFLPLGYDVNTAVYRVRVPGGTSYFLKLRRGAFDEASVAVPYWLHSHGIGPLIPPLATLDGALSARLDDYHAALYPFVEGRSGWGVELSAEQWRTLGQAVSRMHAAELPSALIARIAPETYTPVWRERVLAYQQMADVATFADPVAARLAGFMRERRAEIRALVERAGRLAAVVLGKALPFVLCHADLHAGNVLLGPDDALYIVDWDTLTLAPKERDLMFVGAGLDPAWDSDRASRLFYEGYGPAAVDAAALAYYRCERAVQDIAAFCEPLLLGDSGGADRAQSLEYFVDGFRPGHTVDVAFRTEKGPGDQHDQP